MAAYSEIVRQVWPEWELETLIGKGAYGQVYQARHEEFGIVSRAAVKIIPIPQDPAEREALLSEGMSGDETRAYYRNVVEDFTGEIRMLISLKGAPHVVSLEDYRVVEYPDETRWDILIRMELLTPFIRYASDHPLDEGEVIRLGTELCTALEICHGQNVIHRDIKPQNVFVDRFGSFKLGDFGIARKMEGMTGGLSQKGTYGYIAPEVSHSLRYDMRADVYSVGLVLYQQMNEGRLPFLMNAEQARNPRLRTEAMQRRLAGEEMPPPCAASDEFAAVIMKACRYAPGERYSSASEMKRDLQRLMMKRSDLFVPSETAVKRPDPSPEPSVPEEEPDEEKTISARRADVRPPRDRPERPAKEKEKKEPAEKKVRTPAPKVPETIPVSTAAEPQSAPGDEPLTGDETVSARRAGKIRESAGESSPAAEQKKRPEEPVPEKKPEPETIIPAGTEEKPGSANQAVQAKQPVKAEPPKKRAAVGVAAVLVTLLMLGGVAGAVLYSMNGSEPAGTEASVSDNGVLPTDTVQTNAASSENAAAHEDTAGEESAAAQPEEITPDYQIRMETCESLWKTVYDKSGWPGWYKTYDWTGTGRVNSPAWKAGENSAEDSDAELTIEMKDADHVVFGTDELKLPVGVYRVSAEIRVEDYKAVETEEVSGCSVYCMSNTYATTHHSFVRQNEWTRSSLIFNNEKKQNVLLGVMFGNEFGTCTGKAYIRNFTVEQFTGDPSVLLGTEGLKFNKKLSAAAESLGAKAYSPMKFLSGSPQYLEGRDEQANKMIDEDLHTKFCTETMPCQVKFKMSKPIRAEGIVFGLADDTFTYPDRLPWLWTLFGVDEDGTEHEIVTRDASVFCRNAPDYVYIPVAFDNDKTYDTYLFRVWGTPSGTFQMADICLCEKQG